MDLIITITFMFVIITTIFETTASNSSSKQSYLQVCESQLINSDDQLFKFEVLDSGCEIKCTILVTNPKTDPYHEYYTKGRDINYKIPCPYGHNCINGICQATSSGAGSTTTATIIHTMTPQTIQNAHSQKEKFNVRIHVIDGYIPHDDAFNDGDIKIKIFVNVNHIGNTRKIQDSKRPHFDQQFVAENVGLNDVINFEIWDMDPQWDDFEGGFHTTCNQILSNNINSATQKYRPGCQTSSKCWINIKITCF